MEYCGKQLPIPVWNTGFLENLELQCIMQARLRCPFRYRSLLRDEQYPIRILSIINFSCYKRSVHTVLKSEHQVRLISDSYAQVIAVTIKHTLQLRSMTYFLVWQLRSIHRNFLFPISAISHQAAAVSHTQKINRSHDSLRAQYGRRTRCHVDTIRESLNSPYSASAILIDRNCAWS